MRLLKYAVCIAVLALNAAPPQSSNIKFGICAGTHPKVLLYVPTNIGTSVVNLPVCAILPPSMTVDMTAVAGPSLVLSLPATLPATPPPPAPISIGMGLTGDGTPSSPLGLDPAGVPAWLTDTATLNFPSMVQAMCVERNINVTGAVTGDVVALGAPANIDQGFTWSGYVSFADTVTVRLCKQTVGTVFPVAGVWRVGLIRSF